MKKQPQFRLAVFGSRTLAGDLVNSHILDAIEKHKATMLVTSGEPEGVCEACRQIASLAPITLLLFWADQKNGRGKYHHRSVAVYENCDHVLLIHDGTSHGTRNEIELAEKMNIPHTVITMENPNA